MPHYVYLCAAENLRKKLGLSDPFCISPISMMVQDIVVKNQRKINISGNSI